VNYVDYALIVLCVVLFLLNARVQRLDKEIAKLILRNEKRTGELIDKLGERQDTLRAQCHSLQAQINVAHRAAEHARGVR
jgi:sensor histidine kinase YesM